MDVARARVLFDSFDEYLTEAVKLDVDRDRFMLISRHLISVLTLGDNALAREAVYAIIKAMEHLEMAEGGEAEMATEARRRGSKKHRSAPGPISARA
jgi:hypothetical protein